MGKIGTRYLQILKLSSNFDAVKQKVSRHYQL